MEHIIWFIIDFILIFSIYYFMVIERLSYDKRKKKPAEVSYMINLYKLDINKFSYRKFLLAISLVSSIDIAIVATVIPMFGGLIWQLAFGFIIIVPVIVISFMALGKYYQKKQTLDNKEELAKEQKFIELRNAMLKAKEEKKEAKQAKKDSKKNKRSGKHVK